MHIGRQSTAPTPQPVRAADGRLSLVNRAEGRARMPTSEELNLLVKAVAADADRQAFAALFKHFAPRVKSYLVRAGSSAAVAEELTQEALATVWRKAAAFDPSRAQLSTWVFTIARNLRIDHHRRNGSAAAEIAAGFGEPEDETRRRSTEPRDDAPSPEECLGADQRERRVRQALALLSDEQSLLLRLSFYDERPHARIASDLGIPLGTVKSRIRLAMKRLRALLDGLEP